MESKTRVAVIGGGILGLVHAYALMRRGCQVSLFERSPAASGASIRNFGMIWPIGQPAGEMHSIAMRSREIWLAALSQSGLPFLDTGSLHVAYQNDEADVLREFAEIGPSAGYRCTWLDREKVLQRSNAVNPEGLIGGLWSSTELTVDPRRIVAGMAEYLRSAGVDIHFGTAVRRIDLPVIEAGSRERNFDLAIVCSGDDFATLFPAIFEGSGLTRCKLQMMRTAPQPDGWQLGPALAAGLTLRFYRSFQICATLGRLRERIAQEKPEYDRWGIHILASQTADGAITLGDSHEYGTQVDIFDKPEIDDLILREAATFLRLPDPRIVQRWHGVYALHPSHAFFEAEPAAGVRIITAPGGSGMTLSFGLAERTVLSCL
jgi:FAD dependent oxidoreductase TIGR03364